MFASKDIFLKSSGGGYQISRSVRLRSSASAYLNRTLTTPTNNKIFTISAWVKRGLLSTSANQQILAGYVPATSFDSFFIGGSTREDKLVYLDNTAGYLISTQVFRDPSAWYHIMAAVDTTQATASNRVKLYVNGTQITSFSTANYPSLNQAVIFNSAVAHTLGSFGYNSTAYFDGYMTEFNFIDGQQLTPSSFGETNSVTGVWQPKKYGGTYGTNGFYLNFSDNSAATATTIGKDYSGNGNNWTPNNISVTAGTTYDSMLDTPTPYADGGNGRGNYAVINPLNNSGGVTISDGNLKALWASASTTSVLSTIVIPSTGKFYAEFTNGTLTSSSVAASFGLATEGSSRTGMTSANMWVYYASNQSFIYRNGTGSSQIGSNQTISAGGILQIAIDRDNNQAWLGYNNVWVNATNGTDGNPSAGTNPTVSSLPADLFVMVGLYADNGNINFGQRPFSYTPPTGFVALNTQNLPTPTISNGANYMAATTYTGTGSSLTIANTVGSTSFQPDLVWVKGRSGATDHAWYDAVRGVQNQLESNTTTAETTETTGLTAFGSTGFTIGALAQMNTNAATYVGWQWNAGGSTVTNTSGSISAQVRANPTAGFSVVTYTGTGANATVGHGLGVAPRMIIIKSRTFAGDWVVYHASIGNTGAVFLDLTNATSTSSLYFQNTSPTSSVFSIGIAGGVNNSSSDTYVAYCFAEVAGYSKFGSYTGNGSTDGPFVYCGFRPKFIMIKSLSTVNSWHMTDTSRSTYNQAVETVWANESSVESTSSTQAIDILSNGFKIRNSTSEVNNSGTSLIYMAFAEVPFRYANAR